MRHISAWMALAFGTFVAVAEVLRNFGEVQWWPFWVVNYIAVALLQWGAARILWSGHGRSTSVLAAGWGFTAATLYMTLFTHIASLSGTGSTVADTNLQSVVDEPWLTVMTGAMLAVAVAGLVTALLADRGASTSLADET